MKTKSLISLMQRNAGNPLSLNIIVSCHDGEFEKKGKKPYEEEYEAWDLTKKTGGAIPQNFSKKKETAKQFLCDFTLNEVLRSRKHTVQNRLMCYRLTSQEFRHTECLSQQPLQSEIMLRCKHRYHHLPH